MDDSPHENHNCNQVPILGHDGKDSAQNNSSLQDRILEKLIQNISTPIDGSFIYTEPFQPSNNRPPLSLTLLSSNFRRFNARIGVIFALQKKIGKILSWNIPTQTLSFLFVYSFICLDPYLISIIPLVILLSLLILSYSDRHPSVVTVGHESQIISKDTSGLPSWSFDSVKLHSKKFFRNMRDIQNTMDDYSRAHDHIKSHIISLLDFSDEAVSSTTFVFLFFSYLFIFVASYLIPWRLIFLLLGWVITFINHPIIQRQMLIAYEWPFLPDQSQIKTYIDSWITQDISCDSSEIREVEIFEIQHISTAKEWEPWIFSSAPFDQLSEARIGFDRPKGTRFFEDVQPPAGWEWTEDKWALDLMSHEWVQERQISGVEIEIEGERWVYDLRYENDDWGTVGVGFTGRTGAFHRKGQPSWEESDNVANIEKIRGEWRRRRWVRTVKRKLFNRTLS